MALVIGLWLIYINAITDSLGPEAKNPREPGFAEIVGAGASVIAKEAGKSGNRFIENIRSLTGSSKEIHVTLPPMDFVLDGLSPILPTRLP